MKTYLPKVKDINKKWYLVDAEGKTLGRLASEVAFILRGKHKPDFTPFFDMGDNVIVVNAEKVRVTGNKQSDKMYYRHSRYPGGIRGENFDTMIEKYPERVINIAVKGMLPHNRLGRKIIKHLKVYKGPEHRNQAQQPEKLNSKEETVAETTYYIGTGRRKTATARVRLKPNGSGAAIVNRRPLDDYFDTEVTKMVVMQPFQVTETEGAFDLYVNVRGGGKSGQAGAVRHGIARALLQYNSELKSVLRQAGLLTRDARMRERKKYGQKGARARFQFSKR